jgi:hypothetical protein
MWGTTRLGSVRDHLYAMEREIPGHEYYYLDIYRRFPKWITRLSFDAVILHNTLLCLRQKFELEVLIDMTRDLGSLGSVKIAIPQDEYDESETLEIWLESIGIDVVFSNFPQFSDVLYPSLRKRIRIEKAYPGYVSRRLVEKGKELQHLAKKYDVGYRASQLPYYFGRHGQLKTTVGAVVKEYCQETRLKTNISTDGSHVLYGDRWLRFLARCVGVLGTESGSSLLIKNRSMKRSLGEYLEKFPNASFEDVNRNVFSSGDGLYQFVTISPRHFEAAALKVCQILVRGQYDGVLTANVHYIPIDSDFGNLASVFETLKDKNQVSSICENAYRDLVESGKYSYNSFSLSVDKIIKEYNGEQRQRHNFINRRRGLKMALFCYMVADKMLTKRVFGEVLGVINGLSPWIGYRIRRLRLWMVNLINSSILHRGMNKK